MTNDATFANSESQSGSAPAISVQQAVKNAQEQVSVSGSFDGTRADQSPSPSR